MSRDKIEDAAEAILREVQFAALVGREPVDIDSIFEFYVPGRYQVKTGYTDLTPLGAGILGYTDAAKKMSFVDKSLSDAQERPMVRRFRATAGHEAGHCIFHVHILSWFKSSSYGDGGERLFRAERREIPAYVDPEWQAWEFSRACLMPRRLILKYLEKGFTEMEMAEAFDVNPALVAVRLKTLKLKPF